VSFGAEAWWSDDVLLPAAYQPNFQAAAMAKRMTLMALQGVRELGEWIFAARS
jgi:hypothetical protein